VKSANGIQSSLMSAVRLEGVTFGYRNSQNALPLFQSLNLTLEHSCTAVMGGSGCGKSTLARLLSRELQPQQGGIHWPAESQRAHDVVYVDQNPLNSVFPWLTVTENLRWPVRALSRTMWWNSAAKDFRGLRWGRCMQTWQQNRTESLIASQESAAHFLSIFRLTHRADAYPAELSGGELARLALARCLSWRPRFAIIDESLSQLDRFTKGIVYEALNKISKEEGTRFLLITHILGDAMALADRCLVFGESPVRILGDFNIDLSFPRNEESPEYLSAQEPLLEVLRRGII